MLFLRLPYRRRRLNKLKLMSDRLPWLPRRRSINWVFAACGAPQAPMGGPFLNVPTLAETTNQVNRQQHPMPGQGCLQATMPLKPGMRPRTPQVPQSWTPDRPPAGYRGATGMSQNPFSPVTQGQANPVQQGFAQAREWESQ